MGKGETCEELRGAPLGVVSVSLSLSVSPRDTVGRSVGVQIRNWARAFRAVAYVGGPPALFSQFGSLSRLSFTPSPE